MPIQQAAVSQDPSLQYYYYSELVKLPDILPSCSVQVQLSLQNKIVLYPNFHLPSTDLTNGVIQTILGAQEGQRPREQDVEQDACGPDIHGFTIRFPYNNLGGHEVRSPNPASVNTLQMVIHFRYSPQVFSLKSWSNWNPKDSFEYDYHEDSKRHYKCLI